MRQQVISAFVVGLIFALGLCISGMTLPQNIIAFLDLRHWNPTLAFVMVGGILVYSIGMRLVLRQRRSPLYSPKFELPTSRAITGPLVGGAVIFGVGWGLGGFCGGPALVSLVAGRAQVLVFLAAMFLGMFLCQRFVKL
jgi:uncharacterized membrane protein YedE/YeeE